MDSANLYLEGSEPYFVPRPLNVVGEFGMGD